MRQHLTGYGGTRGMLCMGFIMISDLTDYLDFERFWIVNPDRNERPDELIKFKSIVSALNSLKLSMVVRYRYRNDYKPNLRALIPNNETILMQKIDSKKNDSILSILTVQSESESWMHTENVEALPIEKFSTLVDRFRQLITNNLQLDGVVYDRRVLGRVNQSDANETKVLTAIQLKIKEIEGILNN